MVGGVPGVPTYSTDNNRQKSETYNRDRIYVLLGAVFTTYQITQLSNVLKLGLKISELLPTTTKVNLLATGIYIIHIYNSSHSHDGFLFQTLSEI